MKGTTVLKLFLVLLAVVFVTNPMLIFPCATSNLSSIVLSSPAFFWVVFGYSQSSSLRFKSEIFEQWLITLKTKIITQHEYFFC